ncbi:MAG: cation:proton antiporter [Candidatus Rokuibacteriota bacterium]
MEHAPVIIFVGLLVFLAHLFTGLFERTRVPDVLYLILIGVVVGPLLGIVRPEDFGKVGPIFTTVALVIILFESGLDLSLASLRSSLHSALLLTVASFVLAWAALTAVIQGLTDLSFPLALFAGAALAGPAPSVVIPLVRQLKMQGETRAALTLESAVGEALCIVVGLSVLEAMRLEEVEVGGMIGRLLSSFVFSIVLGGAGGYAWSLVLHRVRRLQHAIFTTPSFVFIVYGICEFLGFSGPIAALSFGIALGNASFIRIPWIKKSDLTPIRHNKVEILFFGEIVFLLKTFFFVYLGISIQLSDYRTVGVAALVVVALVIARVASVRVSTDPRVVPKSDARLMAVLVPKGLATAVLAALPVQAGIASAGSLSPLVYAGVFLSVVATSVLVFLVERTSLSKLYDLAFSGYVSAPAETASAQKAAKIG